MDKDNEFGLSDGRRHACEIITVISIVLCVAAIILLYVFSYAFPLPPEKLLAPVILFFFFLIFFLTALIENNSVAMYVSGILLIVLAIVLTGNLGALPFSIIYPAFFAAPAIASFFTMLLSKDYLFHVKFIAFFLVISGLLFLNSIFGISFAVIIVLIVLVIISALVALAIFEYKENKKIL